jgi:hypothetical protein
MYGKTQSENAAFLRAHAFGGVPIWTRECCSRRDWAQASVVWPTIMHPRRGGTRVLTFLTGKQKRMGIADEPRGSHQRRCNCVTPAAVPAHCRIFFAHRDAAKLVTRKFQWNIRTRQLATRKAENSPQDIVIIPLHQIDPAEPEPLPIWPGKPPALRRRFQGRFRRIKAPPDAVHGAGAYSERRRECPRCSLG